MRLLDDLALAPIELSPRRFGLVTACDGGADRGQRLSVPVGSLCRIDDGKGRDADRRDDRLPQRADDDDAARRRGPAAPGARVRAEGRPGMLPVGDAYLGRAVDGEGKPIDGGHALHETGDWPAGGSAPARSTGPA
jgi:flagellum-specific ATP synthase